MKMRKLSKPIAWFTLLLCSLSCVSAYSFLAILPSPIYSHYTVGVELMKQLARKGHHVTVVSPFPLDEPLNNFVDVPLKSVMKNMENGLSKPLDLEQFTEYGRSVFSFNAGLNVTEATLEDPNVKNLMQSNQHFDAVICEVFLTEALYGLSEHFTAPLIGISPIGAVQWNSDMVGSPSPPSYVPSPFLNYTDHMTFSQRFGNLFNKIFTAIFYDLYHMRYQRVIYAKYFPNAKRSLDDIRKNAALMLVNSHVSLSYSRPYVANHIEVGGMHINRNRKPLPADIQQFIEEAKHGVLYFSMGSILKSSTLPLAKREVILKTFAGLKQRVLWKFEDTTLEGKPDNVMIRSWFPQEDILAHHNVVAFITHGGLLSTTESIYYGKPFIGIPIFGDQFLNMARAVKHGYGIMLNFETLSPDNFKRAINYIIADPIYTMSVEDTALRYHDQPKHPLDLAVHWVEHVARQAGAKYLHCAAQDLNFWVYHNLDIFAVITSIFLILLILYRVLIVAHDDKSKRL